MARARERIDVLLYRNRRQRDDNSRIRARLAAPIAGRGGANLATAAETAGLRDGRPLCLDLPIATTVPGALREIARTLAAMRAGAKVLLALLSVGEHGRSAFPSVQSAGARAGATRPTKIKSPAKPISLTGRGVAGDATRGRVPHATQRALASRFCRAGSHRYPW